MSEITLEAHICDQRRSYRVTFEGPQAEIMAMLFIDARRSTHVIQEVVLFEECWVCAPHGADEFYRQDVLAAEQPYAIPGRLTPPEERKSE